MLSELRYTNWTVCWVFLMDSFSYFEIIFSAIFSGYLQWRQMTFLIRWWYRTLFPYLNSCYSSSRTRSMCKPFWWIPIHSFPRNALYEIQEPSRFVQRTRLIVLILLTSYNENMVSKPVAFWSLLPYSFIVSQKIVLLEIVFSFHLKCLQNMECQKIII